MDEKKRIFPRLGNSSLTCSACPICRRSLTRKSAATPNASTHADTDARAFDPAKAGRWSLTECCQYPRPESDDGYRKHSSQAARYGIERIAGIGDCISPCGPIPAAGRKAGKNHTTSPELQRRVAFFYLPSAARTGSSSCGMGKNRHDRIDQRVEAPSSQSTSATQLPGCCPPSSPPSHRGSEAAAQK